jgi:hypothetical protein
MQVKMAEKQEFFTEKQVTSFRSFFEKKSKRDLLSGNAGVLYRPGDQFTVKTGRGGQGETA